MKLTFFLLLTLCWLSVVASQAQTSPVPDSTATSLPPATEPLPPAAAAEVPKATDLLTGTVLNDQNEPVPGAVVSVVGAPASQASTNSAGAFMLRSTAVKPALQVVCAGYLDSEQPGSYGQPVVFQLTAAPDYERQLKKRSKAAVKAYNGAQ